MAKVVLVTGANECIGFEVSRALGKAGFDCIVGCTRCRPRRKSSDKTASRSAGRSVRASRSGSHARDRACREDFEGVWTPGCVGQQRRWRRHDGSDAFASTVSIDAIKRIFNTNFFGTEAGASFELVELDLANLKSVRNAADKLIADGRNFDVIIANAGVMATPFGKTENGFETQFGTNHASRMNDMGYELLGRTTKQIQAEGIVQWPAIATY